MRTKLCFLFVVTVLSVRWSALAQGSTFTYQGRLNGNGSAANGSYDFRFALFDGSVGGVQQGPFATNGAVAVSNGLFTAAIDFGSNVFTGGARWLEIGVRTNGGGAFSALAPRQAITPNPYAIYAANVSAAGLAGSLPSGALAGAYGNALVFSNGANSFTGSGAGLTGVNADTLGGVPGSRFWQLGGNTGTMPGADFLGTTDLQPLELRVNSWRGLRLEPVADGPYLTNRVNVVAGSPDNTIAPGVSMATIAGGGAGSDGTFAYSNSVTADLGTVGGGMANSVSGSGGTVAGGFNNIAGASFATVNGGDGNWNFGNESTIAGGFGNVIEASSQWATIGGGEDNHVLTGGYFATIPGGIGNSATNYAFAAGTRAKAAHTGTFVWADDSQFVEFSSTSTNQFLIRATGGVGINTASPGGALDVQVAAGQRLQFRLDSGLVPGLNVNNSGANAGILRLRNALEIWPSDDTTRGGRLDVRNASGSATISLTGSSGVVSAASFSGSGSNLTSLNASSLASGTVPDARLSSSVALHSGGNAFTGNQTITSGLVGIGTNSPAATLDVLAASGTGAVRVGGSRAGGFNQPVALFENKDASVSSSPVLRAVGAGYCADGVLSVSTAGTGLLARFGNATVWVADITTNGTVNALAFNPTSDRNAKQDFSPVNPAEVLAKVTALPISNWSFRQDTGSRHIGPMAQDFHAAFGVGTDDKHIATVDADGVALAAIQGLNQKLEQKEAEIAELRQTVGELKQLVSTLCQRQNEGAR